MGSVRKDDRRRPRASAGARKSKPAPFVDGYNLVVSMIRDRIVRAFGG
jgi:hypothetical protein